ncbi:MAG TPA: UDP-3-O-acyl-N-acetylglucosamine deacetylase [Rhodospirillaceae bacterium]|nr:UDP-3-O-acyl-N-acetylglucosamine deacetylase [Rhodospirillaceae bacterium]
MFESSVSYTVLPDLGPGAVHLAKATTPALKQRSLKNAIGCTGVGLHSGTKITMVLRPAAANTGILFRRTDIAGGGALVPAHWASVSDTRLNTCVANADGVSVRTIEHLMAALSGCGIDNLIIDINGPEVPVMDGSAAPFLFLVECAGVVEQSAPRRAIKVLKPVIVREDDKMAMLTPGDSFSVAMDIAFDATVIGRQHCHLTLTDGRFKSELSRARTFGFEQEVAAMRAAGLGKGGTLDNAVVISSDGEHVLNDEGLRYDDEFVRHKALDAVGDLYLAGAPLLGHYRGVRTGHALNNRLLREFFADQSAWAYTTISAATPAFADPRTRSAAALLPAYGMMAASA